MFASKDFLHGICVGADWYIVRGGIQDWTYHWMGGREIVVEMNEVKFPPESQLPTLWEENRESLLKFLEIGLKEGVRGYVRDGAGNPLAATILIGGRSQYNNHPLYLYTDPQVGDYYCFLRAGSYNLTFAVSGYESKSFNDVAVSAQIMTPLDVYFGTLPTPTPCAATNAWNLY
jgi:carboxypeptidase D